MKTEKKTYAASRAHVWAFCEPSESLAKAAKNPFRRATPEQAEGVAIHAAIHAAFDDSVKLSAEHKEIIAASDDAESVIQFCVDAVHRLIDGNKTQGARGTVACHFETVADYADKNLSVAARPDLVLVTVPGNLIVVDFKTGERNKHDQQQVLNYVNILREMNFAEVEGYVLYLRELEVMNVTHPKVKTSRKKENKDQLGLGF